MKGGSYLSVGWNKLHTDPGLIEDFDDPRCRVATHAEEHALSLCGDPRGATIYVARIGRNNEIGMSKPCSKCSVHLHRAGVKKVVYTVGSQQYEESKVRELLEA